MSRRRSSRHPLVVLALVIACLGGALIPYGAAAAPRTATTSVVGPKTYDLALGDSLAFGYQPNNDFNHGYAQQWYSSDLAARRVKSLTNYGCNKESSSTFINGGCPYSFLLHNYYFGSQLNAADNFLKAHSGQVSPVTLDIGANDLLPDIQVNSSTCVVSSSWDADLAQLDSNLQYILQNLTTAMTVRGARTGDLILMNLYNPYQNEASCQQQGVDTDSYVSAVNQVIAKDAAAYNVHVADTYKAFGSSDSTNNPALCSYTWMCTTQDDVHASGGQAGEPGNGYLVIANAFKAAIGY